MPVETITLCQHLFGELYKVAQMNFLKRWGTYVWHETRPCGRSKITRPFFLMSIFSVRLFRSARTKSITVSVLFRRTLTSCVHRRQLIIFRTLTVNKTRLHASWRDGRWRKMHSILHGQEIFPKIFKIWIRSSATTRGQLTTLNLRNCVHFWQMLGLVIGCPCHLPSSARA